MKGLDWFKVMSNITFDDDLEHVSDAEFRTFLELVSIAACDLSNGKIAISRAQKLCNSRRLSWAIARLQERGYVQVLDNIITIPTYTKYQQTREEVEAERAKTLERVTAYRTRYKQVSNTSKSRVEKSKSKEEDKTIVERGSTARSVFDYWRERLNHPRAQFSPERKRKIEARLKDGLTVERLRQAIDGCASSPHHMGENTTGTVYDSIDLIFRNVAKVEEFADKADLRPGQRPADPRAREERINRARSYLDAGEKDAARAMCKPDEWDEITMTAGIGRTM